MLGLTSTETIIGLLGTSGEGRGIGYLWHSSFQALWPPELRSCKKVEVAVLVSPPLIVIMGSVAEKQHLKKFRPAKTGNTATTRTVDVKVVVGSAVRTSLCSSQLSFSTVVGKKVIKTVYKEPALRTPQQQNNPAKLHLHVYTAFLGSDWIQFVCLGLASTETTYGLLGTNVRVDRVPMKSSPPALQLAKTGKTDRPHQNNRC